MVFPRPQLYHLMMIVYVTNTCDNNCLHCYYPHKDVSITNEMIDKIASWAGKQCLNENVKKYHTHILGGEPFLVPDKVFLLVDKIRSSLPSFTQAPTFGQFAVFTNGNNLDSYILRQCKERKIYLLLNPCNDSLMTIHEKMHLIKSICGGVSLAIVADEVNLPRLPELAKLAVEHQAHTRINRLYHGGTIPHYVKDFGRQMHRVFDVLLASPWIMNPNFILESTYVLWDSPLNPHACGRFLVVVDADGTIRSCNPDLSTVCGNISDDPDISSLHFVQRWSSKGLIACKGCEWAVGGWCQGGCPYTRKLTYGTYNKPTPFCEVFKTLFPRLKELKNKWLTQHGMGC